MFPVLLVRNLKFMMPGQVFPREAVVKEDLWARAVGGEGQFILNFRLNI